MSRQVTTSVLVSAMLGRTRTVPKTQNSSSGGSGMPARKSSRRYSAGLVSMMLCYAML